MIPFCDAKPGDESYVYSRPDGEAVYGDASWVTELDWFDDRDEAITLRRQVWRLVSEEVVTLDDPYPPDDDDEVSA